jgi:Big-like domain-containing protein
LTAQPRPATFARLVTLTATVKNRSRTGGTPIGDVTFWDDATVLGTVTLSHGKATFKTSSLLLGPDKIQAHYVGSQDFAPSAATIIENVRAHRSRSKAASFYLDEVMRKMAFTTIISWHIHALKCGARKHADFRLFLLKMADHSLSSRDFAEYPDLS